MKILKRIIVTDEDGVLVRYIIKHHKYLIMLFILIIIYISIGLIYERDVMQQNRLENTLLRVRTKYNMKFEEFKEFINYQNLIDLSNKYNLGLKEPEQPPIKVEK